MPEKPPNFKENGIESKEIYEKGLKIVIGGPPHSGKSVFLDGLLKNLSFNTHYFSACPDGEGPWLQHHYTEDEVKKLRRKGQFTKEFVDFASNSVKNFDGQLMLIDIGGRTSEENKLIADGATHAIVLANDPTQFEEWSNFFKNLGVEVLAAIRSDYEGKEDSVEIPAENNQVIKGSVHYLERGQHPEERETIKFIAQKISALVEKNDEKRAEGKPIDKNVFQVGTLADQFNLKPRYDKDTVPDTLKSLQSYLNEKFSDRKDLKIDGRINTYLSVFMGLELNKNNTKIEFNSPDGYVLLKKLQQDGDGKFLKWEKELSDSFSGEKITKINFLLDPSKPLLPKDLEEISIPSINKDDIVSISGKGPHWLRVSVAMGYEADAKVISTFIPGEGSIIVFSKDQEKYPLGTILE